MDTITHTLLGVVISEGAFRRRIGRSANWLAGIAAMSHVVAKGPEMVEGVVSSWEEWREVQRKWCEFMVAPVAAVVADVPEDVYAHVVAVRHAAVCRGFNETLEALAGLATVAPDLTPVFELALIESDRQLQRTVEELSAATEQVAALGGSELQSTLYGLVMKGRLRHDREVDPAIDLDRTATDLESWIELYPGGAFDEANLLNVLCIKGDVAKAAARLEITHCREVTISGSTWSKEICRACFGGDLIPKP